MQKLDSLTIFFPFYNDEKTVVPSISSAYYYGQKVAKKLEVITIHGGPSKDNTYEMILSQKKKHPDLVIINKPENKEGYAVIKYGFKKAKMAWVFYTDGDLQYHLDALVKLVKKQLATGADVVNGYKINRNDTLWRILFGEIYRRFSKLIFNLPIRDVDCDFRLMRSKLLRKIELKSRNSSVLPEMIIKLKHLGASFTEIPVSHYPRTYGKSSYHISGLIGEKIWGDLRLWFTTRRVEMEGLNPRVKVTP